MSSMDILQQERSFAEVQYLRRLEERIKNNMRLILTATEQRTHALHQGTVHQSSYQQELAAVRELCEQVALSTGVLADNNKVVTTLEELS